MVFSELFQADVDEFCQYYGRRDGGLCFPDFQRKQTRGQDSNYLGDEKVEDINRFVTFHFQNLFRKSAFKVCFLNIEFTIQKGRFQ